MMITFTQRLARGTLATLFAFFFVLTAWAQDRTLTGTVTSEEGGEALPGVNVLVKGTTVGTVTDIDGNYRLSVPEESETLQFSFIGYQAQDVAINGRTTINTQLISDTRQLSEVVVTALGIERDRKALGYAVQQIDGEAIQQTQEPNLVNALNGQVAGVQVTANSGTPGAASQIRIRGNTSITGNNSPLFVIDGIPIDNSITGGSGGSDGGTDGVSSSNRTLDLNPADIASMTVLKGASATALYGIRAKNGAIIITTKKGSKGGDLKITFNSSVTGIQENGTASLQDLYAQGVNGQYQYPAPSASLSFGPRISDLVFVPSQENIWDKNGAVLTRAEAERQGLDFTPVTPYDNVGDFYRTGWSYDNYLSLSGGTDKATYFSSVGWLTSDGIVPNSEYDRVTAKVNGSMSFTDKFTASLGVTYTNGEGYRIQQGSNISGINLGLYRTPPTFDNANGFGADAVDQPSAYQFPDGSQRTYRGGLGYDNPYWVVNLIPHIDQTNRMIGYLDLNYEFTDWMNLTYRIGTDFYSDRRSQGFEPGSRAFPSGQVYERQIFNRDLNSDVILQAEKSFPSEITLTAIVGHNYFQTYLQNLYTEGNNLTIPQFYNISNAAQVLSSDNETTIQRHGVYFDLGFDYRSTIFFNVTGRNDWSSTLPEDNNSYFYPSFNLGFAFSELLDADFLSFAKLRASYAVVGGDAPAYATATYFTSASSTSGSNQVVDGWTNGLNFPFLGIPGFTEQNTLGNNEIQPETSRSYELGLDLQIFENRIGLDVTYFNNTVSDQIIPVDIARSSGFYTIVRNAGEVSSKGFEVVLNTVPVQTPNFTWSSIINFTRLRNRVEELAPGIENIFLGGFTGTGSFAIADQPFGAIYGGAFLRNDEGQYIIGSDGFPQAAPDQQVIGDPNPDWTGTWNNTLAYKGLSLSFMFDVREGGDMWNGTKGALTFFGMSELTENRGDVVVFPGVVDNGDGTFRENDTQVALDQNWYTGNGGGFGLVAEHFIEETSWIRLRTVSLAYALPQSLMENTPFEGINLSLTGRNLWLSTTFDGGDPETNLTGSAGNSTARNALGLHYFNFPNTKSITATLRVTF